MTTRILLVGARGYGSVHLERLSARTADFELVGLVDPAGPVDSVAAELWWATLEEAIAAGVQADIAIIATPIGTHAALAELAMTAGCDVYLEKPPTPTWSDYLRLLSAQERTGRAVQVGFQSLASAAIKHLQALGPVTSVAAWGAWTRQPQYWRRSIWAGRREIGGMPVLDGVVTNPLSHAVITALRVAGARRAEQIASVEVELLHVNDIQADDLSSVRIRLDDGRVVSAALTLCAAEQRIPLIEVRSGQCDALYSYKADTVEIDGAITEHDPGDLLGELVEHRRSGVPLSAALNDVGAFMKVMEAVRLAQAPRQVPPGSAGVRRDGERWVLDDAEEWMKRTARAGALFSELRAPWAPAPSAPRVITALDGDRVTPIGLWHDGEDVAETSGPRPFLHPLTTPAGVVVTDAHPVDHDWHLGISVALQDVSGVNFWGGRTYTREHGYRWLPDHGRIVPQVIEDRVGLLRLESQWRGPGGRDILRESDVFEVEQTGGIRQFFFEYVLEPAGAETVVLSGPGPNGRLGGGYGGLAWRLPAVEDVRVRTPDAHGETRTHGSVADWLALSASFPGGRATIVLAGADAVTRMDPWFVRIDSYPGIGSAVAWKDAVELHPGETLRRRFFGLVADGEMDDEAVAAWLAGVRSGEGALSRD